MKISDLPKLDPSQFISLNDVARVVDIPLTVYCTQNVYDTIVKSDVDTEQIRNTVLVLAGLKETVDKAVDDGREGDQFLPMKVFKQVKPQHKKKRKFKLHASAWKRPGEEEDPDMSVWVLITEESWKTEYERGVSPD